MAPAAAEELVLLGVEPTPRSLTASPDAEITLQLDRRVRRRPVVRGGAIQVYGRWSGPLATDVDLADGRRRITLRPERPFSAGELVTVVVSDELEAKDGSRLRPGGFTFQFWVAPAPGGLVFQETERLDTRTDPTEGTRSYGGVATDLDGDGWLDLSIVNEDVNDVRVFLNDGGRFGSFVEPPTSVGDRPSPSEAVDLDRDGHPDLAVASTRGGVAVLFGRGDGSFEPAAIVARSAASRGLAVLDFDGDGWLDLAATAPEEGVVHLVRNGGGRAFDPAASLAIGGEPWALAAADFDEDGRLDLAVGDAQSERVTLLLSQGDGSFVRGGSRRSAGSAWMISVGDVDRDGHDDVVTVNGSRNQGAVLPGDGEGGLRRRMVYALDPFPLATDLGDLDGDGDLDWVVSSFSGSWAVWENDGTGRFGHLLRIAAAESGSCALLFDPDRDLDLDLALVDELADQVVVMRQ